MYNPEANQNVLLSEYLGSKVGQEVSLVVYNFISQETREVKFVTNEIPNKASNPTSRMLIGSDLKFDRFDDAHEKVFQVTDVAPNSPASQAGLRSQDFIIGSLTNPRFESISDLISFLAQNLCH